MEFNIVEKLMQITLLGSAWVLWLLVILSIVSVAIILERILFYVRIRLDFTAFTREVMQKLEARDWPAAKAICERSPAIECQVVLRGIESVDRGYKAMEENMLGYLISERPFLDRGLIVLGTLGNSAPFIGLFGTVVGIIQAFHGLSLNPAGGPAVVMSGISEALIATAVGLVVAIPAAVFYNAFGRIVKRRMANAESMVKLLLARQGA